jgi:UDP-GlcNAc:undecaprenyl-phosphate GlcNAc-1-phosphate transferase
MLAGAAMNPSELDALYAFLAATAIAALLTPLTMRLARRVGAVDQPRARGLSDRETPLLGGIAVFAAVAIAGEIWLRGTRLPREPAAIRHLLGDHVVATHFPWMGILAAGALITLVGALDDRFDFHPAVKLLGQVAAAIVAVRGGVNVPYVTLPFLGPLQFPNVGPTLTVIGLVAMMNVVNFSDGVDGLAAGVCTIVAAAFAVIAFNLEQNAGGVLAAITAGAALGFLFHNFPPASSFMGDAGSNLLGLLMGCVAVEAELKTSAVVALALPLILLAVPFIDTTFVVLKRLKYRRPVYAADQEHLHHRMARIGFSVRRTLVFFYGWTLMLAGLALALRFIPYSDGHGHLRVGWSILVGALGLIVLAASVYLIYVLEILKFNRRDGGRPAVRGPSVPLLGRALRPEPADAGAAAERDVVDAACAPEDAVIDAGVPGVGAGAAAGVRLAPGERG